MDGYRSFGFGALNPKPRFICLGFGVQGFEVEGLHLGFPGVKGVGDVGFGTAQTCCGFLGLPRLPNCLP